MSVEPGWYKDPAEPTTQRYWDGEGWIGDPLPVDATPPPGPPRVGRPRPGPTARTATPETGVPPANQPTPGTGAPRETAERPETGAPPGTPAGSQTPAPPGAWPPPGVQLPPGTQLPPGGWPPGWPPPGGGPPGTGAPGTPGPGAPFPPGYLIHPAYARLFVPPPRPHGYPLADVGRRLAARLIDIAVLLVLNAAVNGWFVYRLYQEFWPWYKLAFARVQAHQPYDDIPQPQNTQTLAFTITIIAAALWFAYEVPALANRGQTLGKRLLGIKVLRLEADGPLGFGRAFRRWNPMGLATLLWTCGVGFVLQFVDCLFVVVDRPLHQALHDKSAATVVVNVTHPPDQPGEPR